MRCAKKCLAGILTTALLLTALSGCAVVDPQPTETDDGPITLRVVTNAQDVSELDYSNNRNYSMYDEIKRLIKAFESDHEGVTIELEVLPIDDEEQETRLSQLRTEIMAGNGPDIYIMDSGVTAIQKSGSTIYVYPFAVKISVFQDVASAMRKGVFYDIGEFYDADEELDKDALVTGVMNAGVVGDARYVLPLRYNLPVVYANKTALEDSGIDIQRIKGSVTGLYDELLTKGGDWIRCPVNVQYKFPFYAFSDLIDYDTQTVSLTADEVSNYLRNVQSTMLQAHVIFSSLPELDENTVIFSWDLSSAASVAKTSQKNEVELEAFPLRSVDGDVVANVTTWAAVGIGCAHPDVAYDFLRQFLMEDSQWEERWSVAAYRNGDYIAGCPVRPEETDDETVLALFTTDVDICRFDFTAEKDFASTIRKLYDYEITQDGYVFAAGDMDVDTAARALIDALRWHMAEG